MFNGPNEQGELSGPTRDRRCQELHHPADLWSITNSMDKNGGAKRIKQKSLVMKRGRGKKRRRLEEEEAMDASVQNLGSFTVQVGTGKCRSTFEARPRLPFPIRVNVAP